MTAAEVIILAAKLSIVGMVFALGLRSKPDDLVMLLRRPGLLARSFVAINLVPPLFAILAIKLLPLRLEVSASPPELLASGAGEGTELSRRLVIASGVPSGVLQVVAQAATCDAEAEHPACHLTRQDWGVPVRILDGGASRLPLILRGLDA